jgi:hypothetical protein
MAPKLPLPRGWKRRVRSSVPAPPLSIATPNLLDSTIDVLFFKRPESVVRYRSADSLSEFQVCSNRCSKARTS